MQFNGSTKIYELDSLHMLDTIYKWPEFIEEILSTSIDVPDKISIGNFLIDYKNTTKEICICGMGGSAISGDFLATYLKQQLEIPIIVNRNYELPSFVNKNTLTIIISYSGNTEETLSCIVQAVEKRSKIFGISSDGELARFFSDNNLPFFTIPSSHQPRAAFPLMFFPLLKILESIGVYQTPIDSIKEIINLLKGLREKCRPESEHNDNPAKQIAERVVSNIPVIWSPYKCVATRYKCQFNENSKILALDEEIPELNHNHIVAWNSLTPNSFIILAIRFPSEHPNVSIRFEISKEIIKKSVDFLEIYIEGTDLLSQLLYATYLGDYITIYTALLNGLDPNQVRTIDFLKKELKTEKKTHLDILQRLHKLKSE
ncbi:MAG: bifunctional phosphoglucose/phosphomannose isomerase [Candidatus Hodarchaeales archaeon]